MTLIDKLILKEYKKLKEDDAGIRSTLDSLDYIEKGSEIDNGGDIEPHAAKLFTKFFQFLKKQLPEVKIKVTAGNDNFHKGYRSRHVYGEALDFTVVEGSKEKVKDVLKQFKKKYSADFKWLDEYTNPTEHSTGGHYHMAYIGASSVYNKKKTAGELPDVIPGTNKVVNTDGTAVELNTWTGEDNNGTDLAKLDNILKEFSQKSKGRSSAKMESFTAGEMKSHKWIVTAPMKLAQREDLKPGENFESDDSLILSNAPETITFYPTGQVYLYNQTSFAGDVDIENKNSWIKTAAKSIMGPMNTGMASLIALYFGGKDAAKAILPDSNKVLKITNIQGDLLGTLYTDAENGIVFDIGESPQYALDGKGNVKMGHGKGLDILQTVLDYAGFIPVVGDVLDIINAVIYYVRGRYFEAALSLIAVIPIIGSVIKFGVKGAFKAGASAIKAGGKALQNVGLKGIKKIFGKGPGGVKEAQNLLEVLIKKKIIEPNDLIYLQKSGTLDIILKKLTKSKKVFAKYAKNAPKSIDEAIEAFEQMVKNLKGGLNNKIFVKKFGPKSVEKYVKAAAPSTILGRIGARIGRLFTQPRLFTATKNLVTRIPASRARLINKWIQKQIRKDIATDPSKLRTLLKTMSPESLKKLPFLPSAGYKSVPSVINKLTSDQIDDVLKLAAKERNIFYQAMVNNPRIYFRAQLNQGAGSMYKMKSLKKLLTTAFGRKSLDIIYNEVNTVLNKEFGVDTGLGGYGNEADSVVAATIFHFFVDEEAQKQRRDNLYSGARNYIADMVGLLGWTGMADNLRPDERKQILTAAWNDIPGDTDKEKLVYIKGQTTDKKQLDPILKYVKEKNKLEKDTND